MRLLLEPVGTVAATALATVAALQVIALREDYRRALTVKVYTFHQLNFYFV
jgi:hypothetical protein